MGIFSSDKKEMANRFVTKTKQTFAATITNQITNTNKQATEQCLNVSMRHCAKLVDN